MPVNDEILTFLEQVFQYFDDIVDGMDDFTDDNMENSEIALKSSEAHGVALSVIPAA